MKKIDPKKMPGNAIDMIGNGWMLITAGNEQKFNMMTASWGGLGELWHKPVAYVFIRPQRYTFEFVEANDTFTLSFFDEKYRAALQFCGSKSGRNLDKAAEAGLTPMVLESGEMGYKEAKLTLVCRKLYADMIRPGNFIDASQIEKWYADGTFHKFYVGEIVSAWMAE